MIDYKRLWLKIAIIFFFFTAFAGLFLRLLPFLDDFDNKYHFGVLQSHSHTGFLGWVFIALYAFLINTFGTQNLIGKKKTVRILIILTVLLLGIYISFPLDGYGVFSITFLSLFLIYSYYTLVYFYKNIDSKYNKTIIKKFLLWGIVLYFISSIGPWALGPVIAGGYKSTKLYYDTIFFYLHFLYNGFITFSIIALYLKLFWEKIENNSNRKKCMFFSFIALLSGTFLSYSESLLWHNPSLYVHFISVLSALFILYAVFCLYKTIEGIQIHYNKIEKYLITFTLIFFILKIVLQFFQAFPYFSKISYLFKGQFIIGYIHLVTLGFISLFLIFYSISTQIIKSGRLFKTGIYFYLTGFLLTEVLLFFQGILLLNSIYILSPSFNLLMLVFSLVIFIGILLILINSLYKKAQN